MFSQSMSQPADSWIHGPSYTYLLGPTELRFKTPKTSEVLRRLLQYDLLKDMIHSFFEWLWLSSFSSMEPLLWTHVLVIVCAVGPDFFSGKQHWMHS